MGLNIMFGTLCLGDVPVHQQKLLDVGCGTGSFLKTIQDKLGSVTGLEYNEGMMAQAKNALGDSATLVQGSADALPFDTNTFDAVTINQVIHHLPPDDDYAFLKRSVGEIYRVLKPGGYFVLNTSTPRQQLDAFWWMELFPKAGERMSKNFPAMSVLQRHMVDAGFHWNSDSVAVPLYRTLMAEEKYLEKGIQGAFEKWYRDGDSTWSMAENTGELEAGLTKIREMIDAGTADDWLKKREELRLCTGQATFITVMKPKA